MKIDHQIYIDEKASVYGITICIIFGIFASCSGYITILTHTADIFKLTGSSLSANESSIIVALSNFIGIYVAIIFVDRFGRKVS